MPLLGTLTFSWRQAHGTVPTAYALAAFEIRSEINYALAVIGLLWVKDSSTEHRRSFERNLTWPWQLICLEIIITFVFFPDSFPFIFQHFHLQNNYSNNEFSRINYENVGRDSSIGIATEGWTVRESNPGAGEIFRTRPDRPWGPPCLLYNGYRVFPGGKAGGAWCWPPTPF
jgi:hypothetical protein